MLSRRDVVALIVVEIVDGRIRVKEIIMERYGVPETGHIIIRMRVHLVAMDISRESSEKEGSKMHGLRKDFA